MAHETILVADDDADVRLALEVRLKANGYAIALATSGAESVIQAQLHKPDLILLDLGLPDGDGFSVMQSLKADKNTSSIPVIILTGRDRGSNFNRALKAGIDGYLQKPVEDAMLFPFIRLALAGAT